MPTRVAGFVVNLETGDTVPGAMVTPRASDGAVGPVGTTDVHGFVAMSGLEEKTWVGTVSRSAKDQVFLPVSPTEKWLSDEFHNESQVVGAHDFKDLRGSLSPTDVGAVDGPVSSTDEAVARFDGTNGHLLQGSSITVNDDGQMTVPSAEGIIWPHTRTVKLTSSQGSQTGCVLRLVGTTSGTHDICVIDSIQTLTAKTLTSPKINTDITHDDNVKARYGTGDDAAVYYDGTNLVVDPKVVGSGYLDLNAGDIKLNTIGLGGGDPVPQTVVNGSVTGTVFTIGMDFTIDQTGAPNEIQGTRFIATHRGAPVSTAGKCKGAILRAQRGSADAAADTFDSIGGECEGLMTVAQTAACTQNLFGVTGLAGANVLGGHTSGTFLIASIYGKAPIAANGTPVSSTEWAGLFDGDLQVSSDKKLLLEGSPTSKGDTYLTWDSTGTTLDFFINGTEEMNLAAGGLDVVNVCRAEGLRADGDAGGVASTITFTNVTIAQGTGLTSRTPKVVTAGAGPTTTTGARWLKIFDGTTDYWIAVWT